MIYTEFVIRISLSMLLGFLIGLERQLTGCCFAKKMKRL